MINLFPAHYLRPLGSDEGSDTSDQRDDTDDEDGEAGDDHDDDYTDDTDGTDDDSDDDSESLGTYPGKVQDMRNAFLREFSDDEVAEMCQVHKFMIFASDCVRGAATRSPGISGRGLI